MTIVPISDYSFNKTAGTITFSGAFTGMETANITIVFNLVSNQKMYQFGKSGYGGSLAADILTLDFATGSMNDADELFIGVNYGSSALPTGAATAAKQDTGNGTLTNIESNTGSIDGKMDMLHTDIVATNTALATSNTQLGNIHSGVDAGNVLLGAVNETAPGTDTASSGLNGRLQRIAQRITSLISALGSPFQAGGSIGNTSFGSTVADGADVTLGATTDAAVSTDTTGTISGKLRGLIKLLVNIISVKIDQTSDGTTNKVRATATQKPSYGSTTVMTVTNLQSLANSATAGWQSARVSNISNLANDYEICVKLTTAAGAPANDKAMYVYICPFYTTDGGTTWLASSQGTSTLPTGTEGTTTIASPNNLRLLGVLNHTTNGATEQDTFLLSNCFGSRIPDGFSIIIINYSGVALSTSCVCDYTPVNDTLV